MQFFKLIKVSAICILLFCLILTIAYNARLLIISYLAKEQLSSQQIKITCLDIDVNHDMAIVFSKLCLKSPKATIDIKNIVVQWQFSPKFTITNLNIDFVKVIGTDHLLAKINDTEPSKSKKLSVILSETLQPYAEQLTQLALPLNMNITEIIYLPFTRNNHVATTVAPNQQVPMSQVQPYIATLSAKNNTIHFSLKNSSKIDFINIHFTTINKGFSIGLSNQLTLLKEFLSIHQLPITTELQDIIHGIAISGKIETQINYQNNDMLLSKQLMIESKSTDFAAISTTGVAKSGPFTFSGAFDFQSRVNLANPIASKNKTLIEVTFRPDHIMQKNKVTIAYKPKYLLNLLHENKMSADIITILKDNPSNHLTLALPDDSISNLAKNSTTFLLNDTQASLNNIVISAHYRDKNTLNNKLLHKIALKNILFGLASKSAQPLTLSIERFDVSSEIKLANIANFTTAPVSLHLVGTLHKAKQQIDLTLNKNSFIAVNNILIAKKDNVATSILTKQQEIPKPKSDQINKEKSNKLLTISALTAKLDGEVQLLENNVINIDMQIHSQASQLNIPNMIEINSFDIFSQIRGDLSNIFIKATTHADNIKLADIEVSGSALSPKIQVSAENLQLIDLLSLNIKLPVKIELIDGKLDYKVSGHITDMTNLSLLKETPLNASIALTSMSGDIDGTWLQELNFQQNLTLVSGQLTTQSNADHKDNLTIALIDIATPISNLSLGTNWTYNNDFQLSIMQLKGQALGGSFAIPKIQWPLKNDHSVNVQLTSIDLAQVLALDEKQGIVVTGKVSGELPVSYNNEKYTIDDGKLYNVSNGLIQVMNNPAVAELKANNSQLKFAFDALQNIHYHTLSSDVSMADNGYMLLDTKIQGRNPDIDNDVNLNLNLNYDLLGLLKSMSITERFEKDIIKDLQTH